MPDPAPVLTSWPSSETERGSEKSRFLLSEPQECPYEIVRTGNQRDPDEWFDPAPDSRDRSPVYATSGGRAARTIRHDYKMRVRRPAAFYDRLANFSRSARAHHFGPYSPGQAWRERMGIEAIYVGRLGDSAKGERARPGARISPAIRSARCRRSSDARARLALGGSATSASGVRG